MGWEAGLIFVRQLECGILVDEADFTQSGGQMLASATAANGDYAWISSVVRRDKHAS